MLRSQYRGQVFLLIARQITRRIGGRQVENAKLQRHLVSVSRLAYFYVARQKLDDDLGLGAPLLAHELIEAIFETRVKSNGQRHGEGDISWFAIQNYLEQRSVAIVFLARGRAVGHANRAKG